MFLWPPLYNCSRSVNNIICGHHHEGKYFLEIYQMCFWTELLLSGSQMHLPFTFSLTGPLKPEITIAYVAVSLIFFNSGLSLKTEVGNCQSCLMLVHGDVYKDDKCKLMQVIKIRLPPSTGADQRITSCSPPLVRSVFHPDLLPTGHLAAAPSACPDRHRPVAAERVRSQCVC